MIQRTLRILQVNTEDRGGGAAVIARNLLRAYQKCGHQAWLAVGRKSSEDPDVLLIPNRAGGGTWVRFWHQIQSRLAPHEGQVRGAGWLSRRAGGLAELGKSLDGYLGLEDYRFPGTRELTKLTPVQPDLIHGHNLHGGYFDLRALPKLSRELPVVLTLHDAWLLSGHCAHSLDCERWAIGCGHCPDLSLYPAVHRDATALNWKRKQSIFARSRLYIATPSRWLMQKVERSMLAPGVAQARVIPNGVDLSIFHPLDGGVSTSRRAARAALGLPQEAKILLFASQQGRRNIWKDSGTVERAASRAAAQLPDVQVLLLILGETAPARSAGNLETRCLPFQADPTALANAYRAADVYLHAARADTFPNTVTEALACGTPVVATAVGGIPEQVEEGLNGFLAPAGDADAMASRLVDLLADAELAQKLGSGAFESARRRFDLQRQAAAYLHWYGELVGLRRQALRRE